MLVVFLRVRTVDPIQNVQCTVSTHAENVVAGQVLNFSVTLQDNQLGQNSNRFQVNGERPQQFSNAEIRDTRSDQMSKQRKNSAWGRSKLPMQKGILSLIVSALDGFLDFDRVDDRGS
jgi:hypothetical protein